MNIFQNIDMLITIIAIAAVTIDLAQLQGFLVG